MSDGDGCQGCTGGCDQEVSETTQPEPDEDKWGDDCKDCDCAGDCDTCDSHK